MPIVLLCSKEALNNNVICLCYKRKANRVNQISTFPLAFLGVSSGQTIISYRGTMHNITLERNNKKKVFLLLRVCVRERETNIKKNPLLDNSFNVPNVHGQN